MSEHYNLYRPLREGNMCINTPNIASNCICNTHRHIWPGYTLIHQQINGISLLSYYYSIHTRSGIVHIYRGL